MASGSIVLVLPDRYRLSDADALPGHSMLMKRKPEIHVTLLNSQLVHRLRCRTDAKALLHMANAVDWAITRGGDGALLRDESESLPRESLIEWIGLQGWKAFRHAVRQATQQALPEARPHITHFSSSPRGIGLPDMDTISRLHVAEVRLPGIAPAVPRHRGIEELETLFEDGCALLAPGVAARLNEHARDVDAWLAKHQAKRGLVFSAADPFDHESAPAANRARWAMLREYMRHKDLRHVWVGGKDDKEESVATSVCLLDARAQQQDTLLRDYEQLAAVLVESGKPTRLLPHPDLRGVGSGD